MVHVTLTEEEKIRLIDETNKMIEEYEKLSMDIMGYSQLVSRIGLFQRVFDIENKDFYKLLEKSFRLKSNRLLFLTQKIDENKKTLGIKKEKRKKKNKTL